MMKYVFTAFLVLILLCCTMTSQAFAGNRDFGFGLILGEPSGFTLKYMKSDTVAIDGAVAWSFADDSHFHIHSDYLRHNRTVLQKHFGITEGMLALYYGIGGRIKFAHDTRVGMRIVVGVSYLFDDGPMDAFFEIAPIMDVVPKTELNGNAAVGMRYWF